jgi:hypothetical protein
MQKLALFLTALLVATLSFANTATISKNQRAIANSWRASNSKDISINHDVNMVYGGDDVTLHHEFSPVNVTA